MTKGERKKQNKKREKEKLKQSLDDMRDDRVRGVTEESSRQGTTLHRRSLKAQLYFNGLVYLSHPTRHENGAFRINKFMSVFMRLSCY